MSGVTSSGFVKKTLVELKAEYEALFVDTFGGAIDLSASGPFGQLIGLLAKRDADLWDLAQGIYTSRDPEQASGTALDSICAETGVTRIDASPTRAENVVLYGTEGTIIAAGKQARQSSSDLTYSLETGVTIVKSAAREVRLTPDAPSAGGGETYTLVIDGDTYTYTAAPGDTEAEVIDALILAIEAGSDIVGENLADAQLRLYQWTAAFNLSSVSATFSLDLLGSGGVFVADVAGTNSLPANSLNTIVTPVSGWDSVNNPISGDTGRAVETDQDLRIRRASTFLVGKSTEDAIYQALLNQVDGIIAAQVTSNRELTDYTGSGGLPPKSFEAVVDGGSDADVAQVIWNSMPAGIRDYGNDSDYVTDSQGVVHEVFFSRAEPLYVWVKVERAMYSEELYPADGDDLIKAAIVNWAATEFILGKDVIRQRITIPVYSVPGIGDILITVDADINPAHTPVYAASDVVVSGRQIARFDAARIVVEDL